MIADGKFASVIVKEARAVGDLTVSPAGDVWLDCAPLPGATAADLASAGKLVRKRPFTFGGARFVIDDVELSPLWWTARDGAFIAFDAGEMRSVRPRRAFRRTHAGVVERATLASINVD